MPSLEKVVAADQSGCTGLMIRPSGPELTWVQGPELRSAQGCVVRFSARMQPLQPAWDSSGRYLLVESIPPSVISAEGERQLPGERWSWLPGTDRLVGTADGALLTRGIDGAPTTLAVGGEVDEVAVGRAGSRVVVAARSAGASSIRRVDLVTGEDRELYRSAGERLWEVQVMAGGDVLFVEDSGDRSRIVRLSASDGYRPHVVGSAPKSSGAFAEGSAYDDTAISWWTGGGCGSPPRTRAVLRGAELRLQGTPVAAVPPTAWLPDGTLLFIDRGESCDYSPGSLWSFKGGKADKIADGVLDVAWRPAGP